MAHGCEGAPHPAGRGPDDQGGERLPAPQHAGALQGAWRVGDGARPAPGVHEPRPQTVVALQPVARVR